MPLNRSLLSKCFFVSNLLFIILLVGCVRGPITGKRYLNGDEQYLREVRQHELNEYFAANPDIPEAVKEMIRDRKVAIGMTPEQVLKSWGRPNDVYRNVTEYGATESWFYCSSTTTAVWIIFRAISMAFVYKRKDNGKLYIGVQAPRDADGKTVSKRFKSPFQSQPRAEQFAKDIQRAVDMVEDRRDPESAKFLAQYKIISNDDLKRIRRHEAPAYRAPASDTIEKAWQAHPATMKQESKDPGAYDRYLKHLREFKNEPDVGVSEVHELTLENIMRWVQMLEDKGLSKDTIRHYLLAIRRASKMAPMFGGVDVINGLKISAGKSPAPPKAFTKDQLKTLLRAADEYRDRRMIKAILLSGGMGLRISEVARLHFEDIEGDIIRVGLHGRKNDASLRALPLPSIIKARIGPGSGPIIPNLSPRAKSRMLSGPELGKALSKFFVYVFDHELWNNHRRLPKAERQSTSHPTTDKCPPPKSLRKTFATLAVYDINLDTFSTESFLGHSHHGLSTVTTRHYLEPGAVDSLRPAAKKIDTFLRSLFPA